MPTFRHGKGTVIKIVDSGGVVRDISTTLHDSTFPETADTAETSAFGTFDKTYVIGLKGHQITLQGMFDATTDGYFAGILGLDIAGAYTGAWVYGPEGSTNGFVKYTGTALCSEYSKQNSLGGMVGYSATLMVTGVVTRGVFP